MHAHGLLRQIGIAFFQRFQNIRRAVRIAEEVFVPQFQIVPQAHHRLKQIIDDTGKFRIARGFIQELVELRIPRGRRIALAVGAGMDFFDEFPQLPKLFVR